MCTTSPPRLDACFWTVGGNLERANEADTWKTCQRHAERPRVEAHVLLAVRRTAPNWSQHLATANGTQQRREIPQWKRAYITHAYQTSCAVVDFFFCVRRGATLCFQSDRNQAEAKAPPHQNRLFVSQTVKPRPDRPLGQAEEKPSSVWPAHSKATTGQMLGSSSEPRQEAASREKTTMTMMMMQAAAQPQSLQLGEFQAAESHKPRHENKLPLTTHTHTQEGLQTEEPVPKYPQQIIWAHTSETGSNTHTHLQRPQRQSETSPSLHSSSIKSVCCKLPSLAFTKLNMRLTCSWTVSACSKFENSMSVMFSCFPKHYIILLF